MVTSDRDVYKPLKDPSRDLAVWAGNVMLRQSLLPGNVWRLWKASEAAAWLQALLQLLESKWERPCQFCLFLSASLWLLSLIFSLQIY